MDIPFGATIGLEQSGSLGLPDLTSTITGVYTLDAYSIQLQQRYIASTIQDYNWVEGRDVDDNTVASGNYTNMRFGYTGTFDNGGTWNAGLNVTNLLDRDPPIIASFGTRGGSQVTHPDYEIYGRTYQMSLDMKF